MSREFDLLAFPAVDLPTLLSVDRLRTYEMSSLSYGVSAERLYVWNQRMAAAFLGPLGVIEVAVRNRFDARLSDRFGPSWYDEPAFMAIDTTVGTPGYLKNRIDIAKRPLRSKDPTAGALPRSRIIAGLSFNFWVVLLKPIYTRQMWPVLRTVFPARTKRSTVSGVLEPLVAFRNRVAHHEPVFNHAPERSFGRILIAADLLAPGLASWISRHSRVDDVLALGPGVADTF